MMQPILWGEDAHTRITLSLYGRSLQLRMASKNDAGWMDNTITPAVPFGFLADTVKCLPIGTFQLTETCIPYSVVLDRQGKPFINTTVIPVCSLMMCSRNTMRMELQLNGFFPQEKPVIHFPTVTEGNLIVIRNMFQSDTM